MFLFLSLSISCPYLIKFHDFVDNIQERMKHQMGGCDSGPTGHEFQDNSNIYFFIAWEPDSSQNVRTGPVFKLDARWEPSIRFSWWLSSPVLNKNRSENRCQFSANGWEPPNTDFYPQKKSLVPFYIFMFFFFFFSLVRLQKFAQKKPLQTTSVYFPPVFSLNTAPKLESCVEMWWNFH